jgi:hypothetical protein
MEFRQLMRMGFGFVVSQFPPILRCCRSRKVKEKRIRIRRKKKKIVGQTIKAGAEHEGP